MSYHHMQGLAKAREAELRKLASETRPGRGSRGSGLWIVSRGRGNGSGQVSDAANSPAPVYQFKSLASPAKPDTKAS